MDKHKKPEANSHDSGEQGSMVIRFASQMELSETVEWPLWNKRKEGIQQTVAERPQQACLSWSFTTRVSVKFIYLSYIFWTRGHRNEVNFGVLSSVWV